MSKCIKCKQEIYMDKNVCPFCGQVQDKNLELLENATKKINSRSAKQIPFAIGSLIIVIFIIMYFNGIPSVSSKDNIPINVNNDPIQKTNSKTTAVYIKKGSSTFYLLPMADYEISAMLVSKKAYAYDASSALSKMDLLLVWGNLTEKKFRDTLKFSQYGRFGMYTAKAHDNIDFSYVSTHLSNNHIIPASANIQKAINKLKVGDNLVITGYLVNVSGENKGRDFSWESSLSRTDEGDGACEVIYVTKVKISNKVYQ